MVLLALLGGCEQESRHEPNWLYLGQWIDVDGQGRSASETCAGTFEYLDSYAGALSMEFGANQHLGAYRWYSPAAFDELRPCGDDVLYPYSCALVGDMEVAVYSAFMPLEHEVVHRANDFVGMCPNALAEGLAVYYAPGGSTPDADDFDLLAPRLQNPSERIPNNEYAILGQFVAFLVREFGVDSVLEVCSLAGRTPSGAELASAMQSVLGASPAELIDQLGGEPSICHTFDRYQSRVHACGVAAAASDFGTVGDDFETTLKLGCGEPGTVGPGVGFENDSIWRTGRIDFIADASYLVVLGDESGGVMQAEIEFASCEPCGRVHTFATGQPIGPEQFKAGRYAVEVRADASFAATLTLTIVR